MARAKLSTGTSETPLPDPDTRRRRQRVLTVANNMVAAGGESALQMKELAERSQVSLTTLYRDYASKDIVLLELALSRYVSALRELRSGNITIVGDTPGQRAANYLLRQFRRQQREPEVTAALTRGLTQTDRSCGALLEEVLDTSRQALASAVWRDPKDVPPGSDPLLAMILATMGRVTRGWLAGIMSATEARTMILIATGLLDLPEDARAQLIKGVAPEDERGAVGGWW